MLKKTLLCASLCLLVTGFISQSAIAQSSETTGVYAAGNCIADYTATNYYYTCCTETLSNRKLTTTSSVLWYITENSQGRCPQGTSLSTSSCSLEIPMSVGKKVPHPLPQNCTFTFSN